MKNILLLLSFAVFVAQPGFAQKLLKEMMNVPVSGKSSYCSPVAKPTSATGSRRIADVTLKSNAVVYEILDSGHYSYSGTHNLEPVTGFLNYDNVQNWDYNIASSSYVNSYKATRTFDVNDDCTNLLAQKWNTTTNTWDNGSSNINTYDGSHRLLTNIVQTWNSSTNAWDNYFRKIFTYDANGNQLTYTYQLWSGSSWDNNYQALYFYDANNNMIHEVNQTWVSNAWRNSNQYYHTYDAGNKITNTYSLHWDNPNSTWDSSGKDFYTYNASNNLVTELSQYWEASIPGWENLIKFRYSNFSGNNPQTIIKQKWDGSVFENEQRGLVTYNGYGQVLTKYYDTWNVGGFWQATNSDYGYRYYYEEYATDVKSLTAKGGSANVYPVPAKDILNIDLNWNEAQPFTVSIIDLQGRVSRRWQVAATTSYHNAVSVNELPFGTYIIKIDGTKGQVVKQLIVSPK